MACDLYAAADEQAALDALDVFAERWDKKYPKISQSWRENWPNLSTFFKYPQEVRRLIYTTNAIEGFNRQLQKVTKLFPIKGNQTAAIMQQSGFIRYTNLPLKLDKELRE